MALVQPDYIQITYISGFQLQDVKVHLLIIQGYLNCNSHSNSESDETQTQ